jgi:hypothetical protein
MMPNGGLHMTHELSIRASHDWLRSTLEHLASIPRLSDDDFAYIVFEVLDIDARSALSEVALDRLVSSHAISDLGRSEIRELRSAFVALVDGAYLSQSSPFAQIRRDDRWLDVARSSERILSEHVHNDAA